MLNHLNVTSNVFEPTVCRRNMNVCIWGLSEGPGSMAVPAMRPRTSALRMPSTHPVNRNANNR